MTLDIEAMPVPLRVDAYGVVRVGATRVPIDTVVYAFNDGATPEEIVLRFDTLHLADVYAVISYYLRHQADVDAYLRQREQEANQLQRENEARFDHKGIRERLLARRAAREGSNGAPSDSR